MSNESNPNQKPAEAHSRFLTRGTTRSMHPRRSR